MASSLVQMSGPTTVEPMATNLNAYVGGGIVLAILLMLLLMTWAFRSIRTRH